MKMYLNKCSESNGIILNELQTNLKKFQLTMHILVLFDLLQILIVYKLNYNYIRRKINVKIIIAAEKNKRLAFL